MSAGGTVLMMQGGVPAVVPASSLPVPLQVEVLSASLASANAAIVGLAQRLAAVEGKPDPCVALAGALPVATLQVGTTTVPVPVAGLLAADRVAVQPAADLPPGLKLAWAHPKADGLLTVALDALAVLSIKSPIPILVTALR